jgi:serine O-acetyltransferase
MTEGTTGLKSVLSADLTVNWHHRGRQEQPSGWAPILGGLIDIRFLPVALLRVSAAAHARGGPARLAAFGMSLLNRLVFGVECAFQTSIGPGLYFPHTGGIVIGATSIGPRCTIYHQVTLGAKTIDMGFDPESRPRVGSDVVIAAGAKVLGGVRLGDGAIVAANAVVVHDVPARTTVGGVPARSIRKEPSDPA